MLAKTPAPHEREFLETHTQGSLAVCDSPSPRTSWRNRENPAPLHVCISSRGPRPVSIRQASPRPPIYILRKQREAPAPRKVMPPPRAHYRRKPVYRETVLRYLETEPAFRFCG